MKSEIVENKSVKPVPEIDWSKPSILKSESGLIVMSDGLKDLSWIFSGTVLIGDDVSCVGQRCTWNKRSFTVVTEPITITFTND